MGSFSILDLSSSQKWTEFFNSLPIDQQDIYYTPEYYQLYQDYGDGIAQCFVYENNGAIALYPFLKNSVNDLGYNLDRKYFDIQGAYGYNGVVSSSSKESFISDFYVAFDNYISNNNIIAEFTRFHPLLNNYKFSRSYLDVYFDRKTMFIDLGKSYEEIFKLFQTTTRKQIKRCSHKFKIEVDIFENDISQTDIFYTIYEESMARVGSNKYLYFNIEYFNSLILNTKSALFFARMEGKPIAAIIVFYNNKYIHGHLGGALTDYLHTSSYSLLYSEMVKFGIEKGCKYLHAGGGTSSNIDDKLLQFKRNFSDSTADFYIGRKIHNANIYNIIESQWDSRSPEKFSFYKNFVLKYRY